MRNIKLSFGTLSIDEKYSNKSFWIKLNNSKNDFDFHKSFGIDECIDFTTGENVMSAIDEIEEELGQLTEADKAILAGVLTPVFYPLSSEVHESED